MSSNKIGQVTSSSPISIIVEVTELKVFEEHKYRLQVGRYLMISEGNNDFVIALINNISGNNSTENGDIQWRFLIDCQPIGKMTNGEIFERGVALFPVPTEPVFVMDDETFRKIFLSSEEFNFPIGNLSANKNIQFYVDGNKFFGKHLAVVGSTGSGKSCCVSKLLHDIVGISQNENVNRESQNNSHIVIFDIHSEYRSAFSLDPDQRFTLSILDSDNLKLPYWLMNSEELESIFIESNEENSHNQVSQFKLAIVKNKEKHNPDLSRVTYDTPVYFSLNEVYNYISNLNHEVVSKIENENCPKLSDGTLVLTREEHYFDKIRDFIPTSQTKADKAVNGPFNGEFNRFLARLETKLSDKRLQFLISPQKEDGSEFVSADFELITRQFIGYLDKSNVTIIDLSGIPFEVLSITISLVSRIIFDFCYHYSKLQHQEKLLNNVPVLIVCEEAHNYVPQSNESSYRASRKSIERIAKEGRKYGLSLMVVSQRPSEVSETILAQCSNFVAMRLTNINDQNYIKRLMPDNTSAVMAVLPSLRSGECIIVGDAVLLPSVVQMTLPRPRPQSESIQFLQEWRYTWREVEFTQVIARWRK